MLAVLSLHPKAIKSRRRRAKNDKPEKQYSGCAPSRSREYARKAKLDWKTRAVMFLGGRCESCGNNDSRVLQFDHIKGNGCHERRVRQATVYSIARDVLKTQDKYQLLCANCNWIKRFDNDETNKRKEG